MQHQPSPISEEILLQLAKTNDEVLKELQSIHQTLKRQSAMVVHQRQSE
ncbi:MAG: hypothetical protein LBU65_13805 [Planctomycetaceae bacterium]|nr:hypothetical protein [Planctomycetaceae bacterium]